MPGREIIGDAPDRRVEILCEHDAVHATWSRFGPGRDGADLHIHRRHADIFYVIAGELTLKRPHGEVAVGAGSFVRVPPLVAHGFANRSGAELQYLNFHAPGAGFADYMRGLRDGIRVVYDQEDPPADGGSDAEPEIGGVVGTDAIELAEGALEPREGDFLRAFYVLDGEAAGSWIEAAALELPAPARHVSLRCPR